MNNSGIGAQIVGGFFVVALGVVTIAGIYQLGRAPTLTNNATSVATATLTNIFK